MSDEFIEVEEITTRVVSSAVKKSPCDVGAPASVVWRYFAKRLPTLWRELASMAYGFPRPMITFME